MQIPGTLITFFLFFNKEKNINLLYFQKIQYAGRFSILLLFLGFPYTFVKFINIFNQNIRNTIHTAHGKLGFKLHQQRNTEEKLYFF